MCEVKVSLLLKEGVVGATKCGYWLDVEEEVSVNTRNLGSVWLERVPNCSKAGHVRYSESARFSHWRGKSDICNGDLLQCNGIKGCVTPHRTKPPEICTLV